MTWIDLTFVYCEHLLVRSDGLFSNVDAYKWSLKVVDALCLYVV